MTTHPAAGTTADDGDGVVDLGSHWHGGWTGPRREQFTHFMQDAEPVLWRLAWLLTGDRHRCEDLVQQTLVRTYAAWPRARAGDPMAYARRVLVNARTDSLRKNHREVLVDQHDNDARPSRTWRATTASAAQEIADRDVLVRALRQLSPRRRRVVVLRYLLDLSEREVADDLNVSVGTVKSTAARGLAQLRVLLEGPPGSAPTATPTSPAAPSGGPAMTHDDDLVEHLRHLARSTSPPTVDRGVVLRRGERRRAARAGGVAVLAVAAVVASAAGVQALLPQPPSPVPLAELATTPPQPTTAGTKPGVVFDGSTTTVTEPLDAWVWSRQEYAITDAAMAHHAASCMAAAGLPGWAEAAAEVVVPVAPQDGFDTYGLWDTAQADGTGYAPRPDPSDVYDGKSSASSDRGDTTDITSAVSRDCFRQAIDADVMYDLEEVDSVAPAPTGVNPPQYTDDGRAVIRAWADCVRAADVPVTTDEDSLRLVPDGVAEATPDERQRMAAVDLGCKQQLRTTEAIADIVAREQNAYIDRARDHLVLQKAVQDRVLAASIAYLTEQGIEIPATR